MGVPVSVYSRICWRSSNARCCFALGVVRTSKVGASGPALGVRQVLRTMVASTAEAWMASCAGLPASNPSVLPFQIFCARCLSTNATNAPHEPHEPRGAPRRRRRPWARRCASGSHLRARIRGPSAGARCPSFRGRAASPRGEFERPRRFAACVRARTFRSLPAEPGRRRRRGVERGGPSRGFQQAVPSLLSARACGSTSQSR